MSRLSPLAFAVSMIATGVSVMASSQAQAATSRVRYADLDLSTASGRAALDGRIDHAARTVCWIENANLSSASACRRESVADAHAQLQHAMHDQNAQMASR